jgi:hypothetical protein
MRNEASARIHTLVASVATDKYARCAAPRALMLCARARERATGRSSADLRSWGSWAA